MSKTRHQWHQEDDQPDRDRQTTCNKPENKAKKPAPSSLTKSVRIHQTQQLYGHIQHTTKWWYVSYYSQKIGFGISYKWSPKRRQFAWNVKSFFQGKVRKILHNVVCWNINPSRLALKSKTKMIASVLFVKRIKFDGFEALKLLQTDKQKSDRKWLLQ